MNTFLATALMAPAGVEIDWRDDAGRPTSMSVVDFTEALRGAAARRPSGEVTALVMNADQQLAFKAGAVSVVQVNAAGNIAAVLSDARAWAEATTPVSTAAPVQAVAREGSQASPARWTPVPSPAPAPRGQASPSSAGLGLFSESFDAPQTVATTALPEITVVTANTKGGASKTTVAILTMLAAANLAGHNDAALIDINPEGSLADHTVRSGTENVIGLAKAATDPAFALTPKDLVPFLNWQPGGWATVTCPHSIVSNDGGLVTDLSEADVMAVMTAMRRTFSMLLLDTGNNSKDPAWQTAVSMADKILVPLQWDPDTMQRAERMLNDLHQLGHTKLKDRVIFVGSSGVRPDRKREKKYRSALVDRDGWTVVDLPIDRHIASKGIIEWAKLQPRTRAAATSLVKEILS